MSRPEDQASSKRCRSSSSDCLDTLLVLSSKGPKGPEAHSLLASGLYPAKVLAGIAFGEFHFRDQLGLLPPLLKLCSEVASSRNFLPLGDGKVRFFNPDTLVSSLLDVAAFGN